MFVSHGLGGLIVLFERLGYETQAATLHGAFTRIFDSNPFVPAYADAIRRLRCGLGHAAFERATLNGGAMGLHEAHDYAAEQARVAFATLTGQ